MVGLEGLVVDLLFVCFRFGNVKGGVRCIGGVIFEVDELG